MNSFKIDSFNETAAFDLNADLSDFYLLNIGTIINETIANRISILKQQ